MKANGIVRSIDKLGRLVIPKEMRESIDVESDSRVSITQEGSRIIITKYYDGCYLCGSTDNLKALGDKWICESCVREVAALAD